jgi:hypothetical protein
MALKNKSQDLSKNPLLDIDYKSLNEDGILLYNDILERTALTIPFSVPSFIAAEDIFGQIKESPNLYLEAELTRKTAPCEYVLEFLIGECEYFGYLDPDKIIIQVFGRDSGWKGFSNKWKYCLPICGDTFQIYRQRCTDILIESGPQKERKVIDVSKDAIYVPRNKYKYVSKDKKVRYKKKDYLSICFLLLWSKQYKK